MSIADDFVAAHAPWQTEDLDTYNRVIGEMFAEVELYAFDTDDAEGWEILFDPDLCPVKALPYLAQIVGERLPIGASEAEWRAQIKDRPNQRRGSVPSIVATAKRTLTGTRLVAIRERDPDADHLIVRTLSEQTPDPAIVRRDLLGKTMPADIVLDYDVFTGASWADVAAAYASWTLVAAANVTWADVGNSLVGFTIHEE